MIRPAARARAALVVDLGFGDAGKGLVTDALVRELGAHTVVRFNGGAQAGHNVVSPDGRHHTFSQLGAGSFVPGVRTYLSRHTVVHPTALLIEAAHLARQGVDDALARLSMSGEALLITPFHQAANRLRELARGAGRHGSCGVGVGETVSDALLDPEGAPRARHLADPPALRRRLALLRKKKHDELADTLRALAGAPAAEAERRAFEDPAVADAWAEAAGRLAPRVTPGDEGLAAGLARGGAIVFEGAQGVLLDEWCGFHPHTTWSTCTFERALDLLRACHFDGEIARVGVVRSYLTRHGAGPLPTEDASLSALLPEPHNASGPWQGDFRRGWPDFALLRYALAACGGADALALTHLDALARLPHFRACVGYEPPPGAPLDAALYEAAPGSKGLLLPRPPATRDLDRQASLTRSLATLRPVYEELPWAQPEGAERYACHVETIAGVPVRLASSGPRAADVRSRGPLFGPTR
ncbi:MAG: adenylosuccinate synthetase [Polyangiaceae bacterium]|nr:adenylosuccinate synthetase [Polyangiaceae bacterium]